MEKGFKTPCTVLGLVCPGLQPTGRGGMPRAASWQVGWASACRPAEEVTHGAGMGHACRVHYQRGHHAHAGQRGGAPTDGPVAAPFRTE
jgi:hypothetical protein